MFQGKQVGEVIRAIAGNRKPRTSHQKNFVSAGYKPGGLFVVRLAGTELYASLDGRAVPKAVALRFEHRYQAGAFQMMLAAHKMITRIENA